MQISVRETTAQHLDELRDVLQAHNVTMEVSRSAAADYAARYTLAAVRAREEHGLAPESPASFDHYLGGRNGQALEVQDGGGRPAKAALEVRPG